MTGQSSYYFSIATNYLACRLCAVVLNNMLTRTPLCGNDKTVWIDIQTANAHEISNYAQELSLHPIYIQDLTQAEHLPKWEYSDESQSYFFIARFLEPDGNSDSIPKLTHRLAIFKKDNEIISIHRTDVPFIEQLKAKCKLDNAQVNTPFKLLCKLHKEVFKTYDSVLLKISEELDYYESKVYQSNRTKPLHPFVKGLFIMKRRVSVIRKVILLSKTLLDGLRDQQRDAPEVQDATDMYVRIETLVDDLHDRTNGLISIHLALSDMRSNEVQKVLTIFSAFFLPITFIAGVYGMNFDVMPELRQPYGYAACLGFMLLVSLVIFYWFKRKGWL